ncbi:MAG: hypothetical protein ACYTG6_16330, partial [Planctomycetota bacterium]
GALSQEELERRKNEATEQVIRKMLVAMRASIRRAELAVEHPEAEELLRLTGSNFGVVAARLIPRMVDLEEETVRDPRTNVPQRSLGWRVNRAARARVRSIQTLGAAFLANEEHASRATDVAVATASLASLGLWTVGYRLFGFAINSATALTDVAHKVPEYLVGREESEFAWGASLLIGTQRGKRAELFRTGPWAATFTVLGSFLGMGSEFYLLVRSTPAKAATVAARSEAELHAFDQRLAGLESAGPEAIRRLDVEAQVDTLNALADAQLARAAGRSMTALESRAAAFADRLTTSFSSTAETHVMAREGIVSEAVDIVSTRAPPGHVSEALVTRAQFEENARVLDAVRRREGDRLVPVGSGSGADDAFSGLAEARIRSVFPVPEGAERVMIFEPSVQAGHRVGIRLGSGKFATVYALLDEAERVLKVYPATERGREAFKRAIHFSQMLDGHVAQLKVVRNSPQGAAVPYVVQQRLPTGARMLGDPVLESFMATGDYMKFRVTRTVGLSDFGGAPMPREFTLAICRLYESFARKEWGWFDGHIRNFFLVEAEEGVWVAKVLDQDYVYDLRTSFRQQGGGILAAEERIPQLLYGAPAGDHIRIASMADFKSSPEFNNLMMAGVSPWPNGEFFMMKMLERWGFIHFDRKTGRYVDGMMRLEDVKEVFPRIDHPAFIAPDLAALRRNYPRGD